MDVKERSVRLDVLPGTLALQDPVPAVPATESVRPSFAKSLQQADASRSAPTAKTPGRQANPQSRPSQEPDGITETSVSESPFRDESASLENTPSPPAEVPSADTEEAVNLEPADAALEAAARVDALTVSQTAEIFGAGQAPVLPHALPTADRSSNVAVPPISLVNALQCSNGCHPASVPSAGPVPLPAIPTGLQAGLNLAATTDPVRSPAPSVTEPSLSEGILPRESNAEGSPSVVMNATTVPAATTSATPLLNGPVLPQGLVVPPKSPKDGKASAVLTSPTSALAATSAEKSLTPGDMSSSQIAASLPADSAAMPLGGLPAVEGGSRRATPLKLFPGPETAGREFSNDAATVSEPTSTSTDAPPVWSQGVPGERGANAISVDPTGGVTPPAPHSRGEISPIWEQVHPVLQHALLQDRQLTVTLRPPELGTVQIDILRQDGQVTARLQTETEAAHRLLTEHLPQLRDSLTTWGVAADQVQVMRIEVPNEQFGSTDQRAAGQTGGQSDSPSHQHSAPQPQLPSKLSEESEREEVVIPMLRSRTALNLRI